MCDGANQNGNENEKRKKKSQHTLTTVQTSRQSTVHYLEFHLILVFIRKLSARTWNVTNSNGQRIHNFVCIFYIQRYAHSFFTSLSLSTVFCVDYDSRTKRVQLVCN